ncbi:MAG TPA: manganese catalase family protein [Candidatus Egerieicola faecale]|uniref:Manganese catalase family protein n=1 Tax=Candidatus Egerieicola faecale TaxID=2840774 RepID=A0A9D1LJV2_9FIRM|nr:manganese catalase family protein [Candidatus Egerieicola faecale]
MFQYEKKLQYPVKIKTPNPALAKIIVSQLGGPHGEMGAATRYLNQRYSMRDGVVKGALTDIGTEAPEMFLSGANAFFDAFATV